MRQRKNKITFITKLDKNLKNVKIKIFVQIIWELPTVFLVDLSMDALFFFFYYY